FGSEPNALLREPAKVEITAVTIIEKNPIRDSFLQSDVKRDCLVDWIAALGISGGIRIPIHKVAAAFIESRGFFSQAIKMFVETQFVCHRKEHSCSRIELDL